MTFQKTVRLPQGRWPEIVFILLVFGILLIGPGWKGLYLLPPSLLSFFTMLHFIRRAKKEALARMMDLKHAESVVDLTGFACVMTCWGNLFLLAALWTWSVAGVSESLIMFAIYVGFVGLYTGTLWRLSRVARPIVPSTARSAHLAHPFW